MKARWQNEQGEWTSDGRKITSDENLEAIRRALEEGPVITEHWFYYGSSAPDRLVFDDFENFMEYLNTKAFAGDALYVWSFADLCKDDNTIAVGKCPNDSGRVPKKGCY